jgi:hypothetical protein
MEYQHHNLRLRANAQIRKISKEMAESKAAVKGGVKVDHWGGVKGSQ